ncbi:MAG: hypothetical protein IPL34_19965 [Thiofilum sp.]|uniref:hypothetical protein n=1 Tax=Thiofilum sp. TaxID=2212733 RepID=UPI0025F47E4A|nr:hypothetical protein [Thiofilum sp.]MBK8455560.1 hypothetical protein [Thiofilum sp.]
MSENNETSIKENRKAYLKAYKAEYKKHAKQVNLTLSVKEYEAFEKEPTKKA